MAWAKLGFLVFLSIVFSGCQGKKDALHQKNHPLENCAQNGGEGQEFQEEKLVLDNQEGFPEEVSSGCEIPKEKF